MKTQLANPTSRYFQNTLFFMYYFFALCPFISPIRLESDLQPIALCVSALVLLYCYKNIKVPGPVLGLGIIFLLASFILCLDLSFHVSTDYFLILRKYSNYASLFFITLAGYNIFSRQQGINERWIKLIILLWLLSGCIEYIIPSASSILLPKSRTTLHRGVVGLAMEPSFYGYTAFLFLILALNFHTQKVLFSLLCVVQIVFLAQSTLGIVFLLIFSVLFSVEQSLVFLKSSYRHKMRIILLFLLAVGVGAGILGAVVYFYPQSRMVTLVQGLYRNLSYISSLEDLYRIDYSTAERLQSVFYGFSSFEHYLVPQGFAYSDIYRIMSGYGTALYELGFIGLGLIGICTYVLLRGMSFPLAQAGSISISMFAAIQLGSPTLAFVMATAIYALYQKTNCPKPAPCQAEVSV